jgi:hypothetical protein
LDEASRILFEEALLCYAIGAYRAALVFSYLGVLRSVAHRLSNSTRPSNCKEKLWNNIQAKLREDADWEVAAFESLLKVQPASLFLLDEDIRQQFTYWRGRRNDAAHDRTNEISAPHVESLWMFFRSNYMKLIVAGGREGLLERFRRHFDESYTPPGADISSLVAEIPVAVRVQEYGDFLLQLLALTEGGSWQVASSEPIEQGSEDEEDFVELSEKGEQLLRTIQKLDNPRVLQALRDKLRDDSRLLLGVLLSSPSFASLFEGNHNFIRRLWHYWLPLRRRQYFTYPISRSLGVLAYMLRSELIPKAQHGDAIRRSFSRIVDFYPHQQYDDDVLDALAPFGFWEVVRREGFGQRGHWLPNNIWLGVEYLLRHEVDKDVARAFADLVPEGTEVDDSYLRGSNFDEPENAYDLRHFFELNSGKLDEIERVAGAHNIEIDRFLHVMKVPAEDPEWEASLAEPGEGDS